MQRITSPTLTTRLHHYVRLMRLHRPIGILLLLWPALWALWIAGDGRPSAGIVLIFLLGVAVMRSAGCVINDLADRDFDPHVRRTRDRPLAAGLVSPREALLLFVGLCLVAFVLVLQLNRLSVLMSIPALALAAGYPFTKRYTHLPQVVLGVAFGWAVPMAFAAEIGSIPAPAWWLYLVTVLWAVIYDTMYAMVDREDDLRIGVKSSAILFGTADRLVIGVLQVLMLAILAGLGAWLGLGGFYLGGLGAAAALALYQQYLIRERAPAACFRAFLNNNWLGVAIFVGLVLDYWWRS
jgi:4-hydroxybenzoate polyprenyltransferase